MFKVSKALILLAMLALVVVGCQKEPMSNSPMAPIQDARAFNSLAAADAVTSATLWVFGSGASETISIYRVTSSWDEAIVTWSNFGGAFDATVWSTFAVGGIGWYSVDITTLVQAWEAGTYPNYGLLLDQGPITIRTEMISSDAANALLRPYVVVCDGATCDTVFFDVDTYINENEPNTNFGSSGFISIGNILNTVREKQGLIWFEVPVIEEILGSLGDTVWYDDNRDGIQDANEGGVEGVTVQLFNCADELLETMLTDANGFYLFDSLPAGQYYVKFSDIPAGYVITLQNQGGDDANDSDADPLTGETECTTLDEGENDMTWDAGIYQPPQEGCSHTIGYWKTHAGFGPQDDEVTQYLPIWLGTAGGAKSRLVNTAQLAVNYLSMNVYGTSSNGITKLYGQLLGTKFSIADGAADGDVAATIAAADAFLATHDYLDWSGLSSADKTMVNGWKDMLDDYNNGLIGPGHCDEATFTTAAATTTAM